MEAKQTPLIELLERIPQDVGIIVEHDKFSSSVFPVGKLCREAAAAIRAALAQHVEPEPVAWMCPEDPERETAFNWRPGHCDNCGKQRIPLYTAPPQRKPLTDEEIEKLFGGAVADVPRAHWLRQAAIEVVRKTERAHGIGEEK